MPKIIAKKLLGNRLYIYQTMKNILNVNKVKMQVAIQLDINCKVCGKDFMSSNEKKVSASILSELQWNIPIAKCPKCSTKYVWNGNNGFDIVLKN